MPSEDEMDRERGRKRERKKEKDNKRASAATPLSQYFYDVAAFRGSLVKKGFPFVGRDTIAKCCQYDSISPSAQPSRPLAGYSKQLLCQMLAKFR